MDERRRRAASGVLSVIALRAHTGLRLPPVSTITIDFYPTSDAHNTRQPYNTMPFSTPVGTAASNAQEPDVKRRRMSDDQQIDGSHTSIKLEK